MFTRRRVLQLGAAVGVGGGLLRWQLDPTGGQLLAAARAFASGRAPQVALAADRIPRFAEPLVLLNDQRVSDRAIRVSMREFRQAVLPRSMYARLAEPFRGGTMLWGYAVGVEPHADSASWPGRTIVAHQGRSTSVTYTNDLPVDPVLRNYLSIDQTVHWADPRHQHSSFDPYSGPIPTVVHLHGAEVHSTSDGAPEGWFTNTGLRGPGYSSVRPAASNSAIYQYPNDQPATALWFHDHALGITRTSVFAGLAAFYLIRDRFDTGESDNPLGLPAGDQEIELLIQDRQFDTNGQLLFPDSPGNPSLVDGPPGNPGVHPFWIPEFFGDAIVVNGRTWPYLEVEPRRYRFRIVNGSNARFLRMGLLDARRSSAGPAIWQIGSDGGLLDRPARLAGLAEATGADPSPTTRLFLAPGERADVIVDFAGLGGRTFTLTNDAQVPFPSGSPLDPSDPTREIMQFRVRDRRPIHDTTVNPAEGRPLRGAAHQAPAILRLSNPSTGALAAGVKAHVLRQLVVFESDSSNGQPLEDFVNNTEWRGVRHGPSDVPLPGAKRDDFGQNVWMTELPRIGSTEVWEFLNLTVDAHPLHLHLVQFQLLNRQQVALDAYLAEYAGAFPGGKYFGVTPAGRRGLVDYPPGSIIPGYGPPHRADVPNADGALGGNPASRPFLVGPVFPPAPSEAGWKDTIKAFPGYVNRFVIRWAPQATPIDAVQPGQNLYSFDPTSGPGYLVHCHILDHEDNEMMRPYLPQP